MAVSRRLDAPDEWWVFPDGLLRVRTSLIATVVHQNRQTVSDEPGYHEFDESEIESLVSGGNRNLWVSAEGIESAAFHVGLMTGRVNLRMKDGPRIKLLWLRSDRAERPLSAALASWGVTSSPPR
jgi:hypothetical protein